MKSTNVGNPGDMFSRVQREFKSPTLEAGAKVTAQNVQEFRISLDDMPKFQAELTALAEKLELPSLLAIIDGAANPQRHQTMAIQVLDRQVEVGGQSKSDKVWDTAIQTGEGPLKSFLSSMLQVDVDAPMAELQKALNMRWTLTGENSLGSRAQEVQDEAGKLVGKLTTGATSLFQSARERLKKTDAQ